MGLSTLMQTVFAIRYSAHFFMICKKIHSYKEKLGEIWEPCRPYIRFELPPHALAERDCQQEI